MLRLGCRRTLATALRRQLEVVRYSSSPAYQTHHPNPPLELDPAFQALLKDVDISLRNKVQEHASGSRLPRELEIFPYDFDAETDYLTYAELEAQDDMSDYKEGRKSPAARFGSQRIGSVILPAELQSAITRMISDSDKRVLHEDAKRLFLEEEGEQVQWSTSYDVKYKSGQDAGRHSLRDATAFATVALPAHYSVIYAVLDHVKQRLGPEWQVEHVVEWGAATGSGLWACGHTFQREADSGGLISTDTEAMRISHTNLKSFLGIDKREGLVRIGKRLIRDAETGNLNVSWQKSFQEENTIDRTRGTNVMALSAFLLSSLHTHVDRKMLVREMWNSGAEVMVLIDHNFELIAEAREQLLKLGRKDIEVSDAKAPLIGSHVIAPCPHDGACPLYNRGHGQLECGFTQRLQRPEFVRKTKHSGTGHEDMDYSYVVIRRGLRPTPATTKVGRIGDVGRRELDKQHRDAIPLTQLSVVGDSAKTPSQVDDEQALPRGALLSEEGFHADAKPNLDEVTSALREEAYGWPRLVFPPIKRSGHIILDSCTAEGKIMRITIPKSQGKQPFYDARKSNWGDLFPHEPKNPPQIRHQSARPGNAPSYGEDIGKRRNHRKHGKNASYSQLAENIKERRKDQRRARRLSEPYVEEE